MKDYSYTKEVFSASQLESEIRLSAITTAFDHISALGSALTVWFKADLSDTDKAVLDGLVTAHVISVTDDAPTLVIPDIQQDSEKATIVKIKAAPTGWIYQLRGLEFESSKLSSIINVDENGVDIGDVVMRFYKLVDGAYVQITGDDLNQPFLDSNCIRTVIDWEAAYEFYLIGGTGRILIQPTVDIRVHVIAVPDVPYAAGGSRPMVRNLNLRFISTTDRIVADGRATKNMKPSTTYHTNKLRFIMNHPVGQHCAFMFAVEHFKA